MSDDVIVSVRGEASTRAMPDEVVVACAVQAYQATKADALRSVAATLDATRDGLAGLGGVTGTAEQTHVPLAWTAYSATTFDEYEHDHSGSHRTGRVVASVDLRVVVRDFALLDRIGELLVEHEGVQLNQVSWSVDDDNSVWPQVRADAIRAALRRAGDYAAALGGSLVRIDQLADAGLMADSGQEQDYRLSTYAVSASGSHEFPTLDPVVQILQAAIDARVVASVPGLAGGGADLAQEVAP